MYQPFAFALMVPVIVGRNNIAIGIKDKFMGVAEAPRENFKITAIRIGPDDDTLIRIVVLLPVNCSDTRAYIPNAPIDLAIRTLHDP